MKILFDDRWIGSHGIGRFARELAARLPFEALALDGSPASPVDPLRLSLVASRLPRGSFFFSPGYNGPFVSRAPYAICVHDLNHIDRPENGGLLKRLYYRLLLGPLARRARAVLTVSEFSRQRIIDFMKVAPDRVINVGNGVSAVFGPAGEKFAPGYQYVLCVSNRKGHKNEERLVRAFAASGQAARLTLLLTGASSPALVELARSLGIAESLRFAGHVSEEELAALYRGAQFLVFPSLYEGFGLPIVEAFACGVPVITSNVTSMPEIAGDAAVMVDPMSEAAISEAIARVAQSSELRAQLAARGLARVGAFTWDAVAARVADAIGLPPASGHAAEVPR